MPEEEVKIVVKQESRGTAIADTQRKIQELYKTAAAYEAKGMDTAAKSARGDAHSLEKDIARQAREHANEQRGVTRELREQEAVMKARGTRLARLGNAAANFVEGQVGVGGVRGVQSALGGIGGGAGIAAAVAVAVAGAIRRGMLQANYDQTILGMQGSAARTVQARHERRMGSFEGSAAGSRSEAQAARDEIVRLAANRGEIAEEAKAKGWKPSTWLPALTGENQKAGNKNEQEIQLAMEKELAAKKNMRSKFAAEGGLEIEQQKARVEGRYKEAIGIDMAAQALKRYRDLRAGGATEDEAREGAKLTLRQREIDVQRGLGSLAGARDGRGNLAALASLGASFSGAGAEQRLDRLISIVDSSAKQNGVLKTHVR